MWAPIPSPGISWKFLYLAMEGEGNRTFQKGPHARSLMC